MQKTLRAGGIYRLPDEREFVVGINDRNDYILFGVFTWKYGGAAQYLIRADGKVLSKGVPTRWGVGDLIDTGRTAELR
jgi:hypothetical protein